MHQILVEGIQIAHLTPDEAAILERDEVWACARISRHENALTSSWGSAGRKDYIASIVHVEQKIKTKGDICFIAGPVLSHSLDCVKGNAVAAAQLEGIFDHRDALQILALLYSAARFSAMEYIYQEIARNATLTKGE
jgi:hypothetical protein